MEAEDRARKARLYIDRKDDGSFEKLKQDLERQTNDKNKAMELLERQILRDFVIKIRKDADLERKRKEAAIGDSLSVQKKRKRNGNGEDDASSLSKKSCLEDNEKKFDCKKKIKKSGKKKGRSETVKLNLKESGLDPPPDIPDELERKIESRGGTDIKLVITKQMFGTDIDKHQDRFNMPRKQMKEETFLTEEEKRMVAKGGVMEVNLLQPCGHEEKLIFALRDYKKEKDASYIYIFRSSWKKVLDNNLGKEFVENDIMQVWSFRVEGELQFALIRIKKYSELKIGGNGDGGDGGGSSSVIDQQQDEASS